MRTKSDFLGFQILDFNPKSLHTNVLLLINFFYFFGDNFLRENEMRDRALGGALILVWYIERLCISYMDFPRKIKNL